MTFETDLSDAKGAGSIEIEITEESENRVDLALRAIRPTDIDENVEMLKLKATLHFDSRGLIEEERLEISLPKLTNETPLSQLR